MALINLLAFLAVERKRAMRDFLGPIFHKVASLMIARSQNRDRKQCHYPGVRGQAVYPNASAGAEYEQFVQAGLYTSLASTANWPERSRAGACVLAFTMAVRAGIVSTAPHFRRLPDQLGWLKNVSPALKQPGPC